ncbi:MAG: gas vesicle protein [Chlamydiota bacterium]
MLPTRPNSASLTEVLNRLLDKGVFLKAELTLSLANVPLIKIDLTALIAGIETFNEMKHGEKKLSEKKI